MTDTLIDNTTTDLTTGSVAPFMYAGEAADNDGFEVDDTVNIPYGEYEELIEDSTFLGFLRDRVGPEVWQQAEHEYEKWNSEVDEEEDVDGGTQV